MVLRKCCPSCSSLRITRYTRKGGYSCAKCGKHFQYPAAKDVPRTSSGTFPKFLREVGV